LIIGCGHPTLQRIIDRAEMVFQAPLYGVVGGLHYPVTDSRARRFGLPLQQFLGAGKWPWDPITRSEVLDAIAYLRRREPKLVSLSPHDSCDWSLDAFRDAFGDAYFDLLVGRPIEIT
jgi:7,8-dihydropterin-6-yl-methyl-4-(beta-D-ribofuranosyl)aminobenzene 5'-phosphate synthase